MQFLATFFPRPPRPRPVVPAGPLLIDRPDELGGLRRYLRSPRQRELFLLHQGEAPLRRVADEVGVVDITLSDATGDDADDGAREAAEMALALGAERLDFAIDEPGVADAEGLIVRALTPTQAEIMAHRAEIRPRIRAKLRAGAAALRLGASRVRIGSPSALKRDRATELVPDLREPQRAAGRTPLAATAPEPALAARGPQARVAAPGAAGAA